jgi:hypothetical protein
MRLLLIWMLVQTAWLILPGSAAAQDPSFTASVDRNRLSVGEQFEITFSLSGQASSGNFQAPMFNNFIVLAGPNQSTSMQFVNGAVSSSVSYSYNLQAKAVGKFTIGPATLDYNGKQLKTNPVIIEVLKGGASQPNRQGQPQQQQAEDEDIGKQIGDNLFLKVRVDKSRVYQGEQIVATYKIYTRVNVANYNMTKVPALTGFWSEDLEVPKQIQLSSEVVNGKQYRVGILKKVALFPQRAGTLEIDPMDVDCAVQVQTRRRSNDFFNQFFNDPFFGGMTNVNHKLRSEPLKITVLPLPAANVPPGYSGAVGKLSMEAWLDKRQTRANEPVTLKVKISGRGNLKLLEAPAVTVPPDIERFDPKITDNISRQGDLIAGSRTFEYLLIPRHAGQMKIPSVRFSYFDDEKKSYVSTPSSEFVLTVDKGSDLASSSVTGISKEDVKLLGEDIRFIKSGGVTLRRRGESFVGSPAFFALSFTPVIAFVGFVVFARKREKMLGDVAGLRNRKARKVAQKRLTAAKRFLSEKKEEQFYNEISRALWGYVGDKLGIPPSELSLDSIRASLIQRGVDDGAVAKLSSTIEQCEFARFAPSSDSMKMDSFFNEAIVLISTIEDQLA